VDLKRYKTPVAALSVLSNSALVIMKIIVGLGIGSVSVISEAIHSGMDLLASIIALFSVRKSAQPADDSHPFGHGKFENVSGTVEAMLIFVAAGWIIDEAIHKLSDPRPLHAVSWGIIVMAVSAAVNIVVAKLLFKVGRATDSVALEADAWHLQTDVYTSAGVLGGLAIIGLGHRFRPDVNLDWVDPVAAIGVALLIIKAAFQLVLKSTKDILDVSLPKEEIAQIREVLVKQGPRARAWHALRTRKAGATRFVEVHLLVDKSMSVNDSHRITQDITRDICALYPDSRVTVHVEPCNERCDGECVTHCRLEPEKRPRKQKAQTA
jgi:cation diffusion facilitator family transporter